MVLKRSNVEYARWEETVTYDDITLEKAVNITNGHVYQVVVKAYVYNTAGKLVETQTAETSIYAYKHRKTETTKNERMRPFMQTEDAPELTPEFLEDLRRYTEYGWGPGITAALLNRWHPVALTSQDVIRLRRRLGRAAAPTQDTGADAPPHR